MNIVIMGTGYVGVTTGLLLAELGHRVTGYDPNETKVKLLAGASLPFYEPGLDLALSKHVQSGAIRFTTDVEAAIAENDIVFICVGTPPQENGSADLQYIRQAAQLIGRYMTRHMLVVVKSTVPVGTNEQLTEYLQAAQTRPISFDMVSNPEFLREGSAWYDALHPDRIVIGANRPEAAFQVRQLYGPITCPVLVTTTRTAELIKYAANAFLAARISFMNELARLCEQVDVPVTDLAKAIGLDHRIGPHFLRAGIGYGGSCFPKDVNALLHTSSLHQTAMPLLEQVQAVNGTQIPFLLNVWDRVIGGFDGQTVAILGLSFKPDTDDLREAPSLGIITRLASRQAELRVHDPVAKLPGELLTSQIRQHDTLEETLAGCDALIVCSEWRQYKEADWAGLYRHMKRHFVFDGRNMLNPKLMKEIGYRYHGVGVK